MKRRISIISFCLLIAFTFTQSLTVLACDEEQNNTYVTQILFGDDAGRYENNDEVKVLLNALYLCSVQSDKQGQDKLDFLKANKVSGLPKLATINLDGTELLDCSHVSWDTEYSNKKLQKSRKKILRNAVEKVFDFGFFEEMLDSTDGQSEAFIELLYYSHILSDYLADSPEDTEVNIKNGSVPSYSGNTYVELNGNRPTFTSEQKTITEKFFEYSDLDQHGRSGTAIACLGPETLGTNEGKSISNITPSGWNQQSYDDLIGTSQLYNRSHIIGRSLGGHDTRYNLITGTRYLNSDGMVPFEDKVRNYIEETGNHVIYRVSPVYKGNNFVATGVQMEAYSVEDKGKGVSFNVFCYNVQPGVHIDYANGDNERSDLISESSGALQFANADYQGNPDLIELMNGTLEQLFSNSLNSQNYSAMSQQINSIAIEARNIDTSSPNGYVQLKNQEYKYLNVLKNYVPKLLNEESFFQTAF